MNYQGGKEKIAEWVAHALSEFPGDYYEPFVGGASIASRVVPTRQRSVLADVHRPVVSMWKATASGWRFDGICDEDRYYAAKLLDDDDPNKAAILFGCSFGGKGQGGFARESKSGIDHPRRLFARNAARSIAIKGRCLGGAIFRVGDYRLTCADATDALIYCDPPYAGTTGYRGCEPFQSDQFWSWCRKMSSTNVVIVSEYAAPDGVATVIGEITKSVTMSDRTANKDVVEKLFRVLPFAEK